MGNGNNSTAEIFKVVLKYGESCNIKVICWLVKKEYIRRCHEYFQQIQPFSLAARKLFYPVPLKLGREKEAFKHLRSGNCSVGSLHSVGSLAYILDNAH